MCKALVPGTTMLLASLKVSGVGVSRFILVMKRGCFEYWGQMQVDLLILRLLCRVTYINQRQSKVDETLLNPDMMGVVAQRSRFDTLVALSASHPFILP